MAAYDSCKTLPMVTVSLYRSPNWTEIIGFINNKNTFSLTEEEKENLKDNLFELLSKLYDNYRLHCIDINQLWVYETCYYTFTFESILSVDRQRENIIATGCVQFMQNFTDGDGQFISFTKLDRNSWIYQFNFKIS